MYNKLKIFLASIFILAFASGNAYAEFANSSGKEQNKFEKYEVLSLDENKVAVQEDLVQIKPEEISFDSRVDEIKEIASKDIAEDAQESLIRKEKVKYPIVNLNVKENLLFGRSFEKKFETGIFKDVKLIGGNNLIYTALNTGTRGTLNTATNEVFLFGLQGHIRDKHNTMFNVTYVPTLSANGFHKRQYNRLFEYYLRRNVGEHHTVTVGQQRTPNLVDGSRSIFCLPIGRRSMIGSTFSNITAIGAQVQGNFDKVDYRAGVFDTGRFLVHSFESAPEYAGLVSFKPIKNTEKYGKLKVGGSVNAGKREYSYNVMGAHLSYDYKRWHFDSEYAYANGYSARSISNKKADGYHLTMIYDVNPKIQAFCRVDTLNSNRAVSNKVATEYTAGMHYFLKGPNARLTLSYIHANYEWQRSSNRLFTMLELLVL